MPPESTPLASLTSFDWALLLLVLMSTVAAFLRGIIKVLFSLAGLITGLILACWNYPAVALGLHRWIGSLEAAQIVAFLFILALVMILFSVVASLLRRTVSAVGLGFVDRLLGALFGLLRGVLLGVAAMMAIAAFLPGNSWVRNSQLSPYFLAGAHALSFVVPENFRKQIAAGATHLLQGAPDLLWQGSSQKHP